MERCPNAAKGDCVITVQLAEEDKVEDDVVFYLVFTGSTVQHCTSTRKINSGSLETIAPGHDFCETVRVALCAFKKGHPVLVVAEESFQFVQDEAYDAAQFLATCAGNQQALNFTRFLDRSRPPAANVEFLDEKVALAFRHLKLPAEWNVLGADQSLNENIPRETLMHFAARLGLLRLTWFLLQQPGGRGALSIRNTEGATPVTLALERGYQKLHQLLTEEEAREPDSWSALSHTVHSGDYCVKHHRGLDVYMLTAETKDRGKASLEDDIRQLRKHMQSHRRMVRKRNPEPSRQLLDQTCQEDKCNSESLGALSDAPNDLKSLRDAKNPECSCESKNTVTLSKKEEEEPTAVAGSGTVSDKNDSTLSLSVAVNGAVSLPSCGNTNEEAGMTSAGVVLDPASLCSKDSTHQEVQVAEERAVESAVTVAETAGKTPASLVTVDVVMGQTECRNCTGTADRAPGPQQIEDGMAETSETRTANLKEQSPAKEESASDITANTGAVLPAVNGVKAPACAPTHDPVLEIHDSSKNGEQEMQVEGGSMDAKSSSLCPGDCVETDGPAKPENDEVDGPDQSNGEPVCCQESSKNSGFAAQAMEGSRAHEEEAVGTDTSSSGDRGSSDSANGGQEVASCCPSVDETGVKDEMSDSTKSDTAQESKHEPGSLPLGDASTCLPEKEPPQDEAEIAESAPEQEGLSEEAKSLPPLPGGDGPAASREGAAAVAPPRQEAALQGNDPELSPSAKGAGRVQDNLIGTPSVIHNEDSKQNQEAAAAADSAGLPEHGKAAAQAALPVDHAGEEGSREQSLSQQAEGDKAELHQEACESSREKVLSEELVAALVKAACSQEVPAADGSTADAGLKEKVPGEEAYGTVTVDAEVTVQGLESEDKLMDAVDNPCLDVEPKQECDPNQGISPRSITPELKDPLEMEAPTAACEDKEVLRVVAITPVAMYPEEQEDMDSVLPRAALQPIAEEPTCDSDSMSLYNSFCFAPLECESFLEDGLSSICTSSQGVLKRESGSESELFPLPGDGMEDIVFGKPEEEQSVCDVTSSSSSADDTMSLERNSSLGSDTSLPFPPTLNFIGPKDRCSLDGSCINMVAAEGREGEPPGSGETEEELDSITDVPTHSSVLRNSMRPLSPFRRHSWGPGKNATNEAEINQRSYSLEGLAGDPDENKKPSASLEASSLSNKDLRRSPLANDECGSLVSLTEELEQGEIRDYDHQMHQRSQPQEFHFCASAVSSPLTKSMCLMAISKPQEKEKEKEKTKEKDKESKEKEKDKKLLNGHLFTATSIVSQATCYHCMKPFSKDSYYCAIINIAVNNSVASSLLDSQPKERPRSAILAPDENTVTSIFNNRRSQQTTALSKSVSIQNIAGVGNDDSLIHTWKFLSQSTDSLHKISRVNESMESLIDEGADMNEGQLMGDLELDSKQLEAESWSQVVDSKFLRQQKKDIVKRQDVIYELMQTEMHHVRTLKIMNDVYSAGMVKELQYDQHVVDKIFPCLENLLHIHSHFFQRILERKRESLADKSEKNFVIKRIGDILVYQFSGESAERMKKTYGKFCGHHNEAVNNFKDLYSKDKRFQAFVKKKMSSSVVRRLGIPECILLVTQRITKYPVLLQRILQYTKENEVEHQDLTRSLNLVKDVIAAVNSKVSNYEKKMRLDEIYTRTDSKSIMRMKSGQMFAKEDLRHRKLIRDGPVSLKNAAGRLKEVQAVLLSDMLVFLQEKDQKYVFASLDQKSTVISLKKLIVREVAHEEKGLFLISMGAKDPEMVEVHASSKEERSSWIQIIQDTINTMDKDEDEGVPSESELEKRVSDTKVRELKEQLQQKDKQILTLLEEKEKIFRDMADCSVQEDLPGSRVLFRASTEEAPKGEAIMKSAINEVELLQGLVSRSLGSALGQQVSSATIEQEGGVGPVSLPRRAETFGGFDSHQMNASKGGEKDEGDDAQDLRRTESDSILKKGCSDFSLPPSLPSQAVVLQQDTFIEDQKLALSERALTRSLSRPNSLIEQEKQRNLEKQRQELANLQKQQAQHQEEKRRREKEWEAREKELTMQEAHLAQREEQVRKGHQDLERERDELQVKKASYQLDLERLRTAQKQLEREKEQLKRDMERLPQTRLEPDHNQVSNLHDKLARVPSLPSTEDSSKQKSPSLLKQGHFDAELSVSPKRNSLSRTHKEKSTFHLLSTTNQTNKAAEGQPQMPTRLFSLAKPKEKKEKKKKGKGHRSQPSDSHSSEAPPEGEEIFC
uniref:A-kinase anchoring protein 13 n=1 Tax=Apteryx owenii TaxID=8824 RepID=A0A8B9P351_APTOW